MKRAYRHLKLLEHAWSIRSASSKHPSHTSDRAARSASLRRQHTLSSSKSSHGTKVMRTWFVCFFVFLFFVFFCCCFFFVVFVLFFLVVFFCCCCLFCCCLCFC